MKKPSIIILHGWRVSGDKYKKLKEELRLLGYKVYAPDLPGFGENILKTKRDYTLFDFAKFLKDFIFEKQLDNAVLMGHSMGGRVIVKFINLYGNDKIKGIILSGTPLIKEKFTIRKLLGVTLSNIARMSSTFIPATLAEHIQDKGRYIVYRIIGEMDYYKSGQYKQTFLNIVSEDVESYLSKISVPTLILWGENDKITPVSIGRELNRRLPHSKLVIIKDATHKLPHEKEKEFASEIDSFVKRSIK